MEDRTVSGLDSNLFYLNYCHDKHRTCLWFCDKQRGRAELKNIPFVNSLVNRKAFPLLILPSNDQEFSEIEEENTTTIKFSSSQSTKVLEWVLSQGVNARPIAPAEFVERWKKEIRGLAKAIK